MSTVSLRLVEERVGLISDRRVERVERVERVVVALIASHYIIEEFAVVIQDETRPDKREAAAHLSVS